MKALSSIIVLFVVGLILAQSTIGFYAVDKIAIEVECPLEEAGDEDPDNENEEEKLLHGAVDRVFIEFYFESHQFVYQINYSELIKEVSAPPPRA